MPFEGFPEEVFAFYRELKQNNDRDWWYENRYIYDDIVLPAAIQFIDSLDLKWHPMTVYRPYRNVRFSPDKTPYKNHLGIIGADEHDIMHYFHLQADYALIARGMHWFSPSQLLRWYDAVHEDPKSDGEEYDLDKAARLCRQSGLDVGGRQKLSTSPRGFSRQHRRVEWLRLGGVDVSRSWASGDVVEMSGNIVQNVQDSWRTADPICDWLAREVGPDDLG